MKTIHAFISWPLSKQHNSRVNSWRLGHLPRRLRVIFSRWRCSWPRAPVASTADVWWCVYTADRWTMNCWSDSFKVICYFVLHDTCKNHHTNLTLHVICTYIQKYRKMQCGMASKQHSQIFDETSQVIRMKAELCDTLHTGHLLMFIYYANLFCTIGFLQANAMFTFHTHSTTMHFRAVLHHSHLFTYLHSKRLTNEECESP